MAQALTGKQSSSSNEIAGKGLRTAAGAGASALAHYLCDPPGHGGMQLFAGMPREHPILTTHACIGAPGCCIRRVQFLIGQLVLA